MIGSVGKYRILEKVLRKAICDRVDVGESTTASTGPTELTLWVLVGGQRVQRERSGEKEGS